MKVASLEIDLLANVARLQADMNRAVGVTNQSMAQIERAVQSAKAALATLGVGVGLGALAAQAIQLSDAYQGMENRLRLVTNGQRELSVAMRDVYDIAQRTSQGMDGVTQVYQRFAQNAKVLGINQAQVAALTDTVSKTIAISGASAQSADAALMQFGQALASGVLRGEEFNSIMEQTPSLMQALATGLGVPLGQMRDLAAQGAITSDKIVQALTAAGGAVDAQFGTRVKTVSQSFTELQNAVAKFVGEAGRDGGVAGGLSEAISFLARHLDAAATAAATMVGVGIAMWFHAATAGAASLGTVLAVASRAMSALFAAMGPLGWAALAIGGIVTAWQLVSSSSKAAGSDQESAMSLAISSANTLNERIIALIKRYDALGVSGKKAVQDILGAQAAAERAGIQRELDALKFSRDQLEEQRKAAVALANDPQARTRRAIRTGEVTTGDLWGSQEKAGRAAAEYVTRMSELEVRIGGLTQRLSELDQSRTNAAARLADEWARADDSLTKQQRKLKEIAEVENAFQEHSRTANPAQLAQMEAARAERLIKIEEKYKEKVDSTGQAQVRAATAQERAAVQAMASIQGQIEEQQALNASLRQQGVQADKLTAGERLQIRLQQQLGLAVKDRVGKQTDAEVARQLAAAKTLADLEKENRALEDNANVQKQLREERGRYLMQLEANVERINEQAQAAEDEVAAFGRSKASLAQLTIARLDDRAAMLANFAGSEDEIVRINREIDARRRLARALDQQDALEANAKAAEDAASEWERVTDQVGQSLADRLMQGGVKARDLLVDLFRTMVLRPALQPVVAGGMSAIGAALGMLPAGYEALAGTPARQPGQFGLGGLFSNFGGSVSDGLSNFAWRNLGSEGMLGGVSRSILENAQSIERFTNIAGDVIGYGSAVLSAFNGKLGSAAGGAIGTYLGGPIGSFIGSQLGGLVDGLFDGGEKRAGGSYGWTSAGGAQFLHGPSGGAGGNDAAARAAITTVADAIGSRFAAIGTDVIVQSMRAGFEQSGSGRGGVMAGVLLSNGVQVGQDGSGSNYRGTYYSKAFSQSPDMQTALRDFQTILAQVQLQALQAAAETPAKLRALVGDQDVSALSADTATQLLATVDGQIAAVTRFNAAVAVLPFANLHDLSYDAAAGLIEMAGGIDALAGNLQTYYTAFYSEQERAALSLEQMNVAAQGLGVSLPVNLTSFEALVEQFGDAGLAADEARSMFRALVEGQDATTEAGQKATAGLLAMAGQFSEWVDSAEAQSRAAIEAAQKAAAEQEATLQKAIDGVLDLITKARDAAETARDDADAAAGTALQILRNAIDLQKRELTRAWEVQREALQTSITAASDAVAKLRGLSERLGDTLGSVFSTQDEAMQRARAQAQITDALNRARAGGALPSVDELDAALSVIAKPSEQLYRTFEEYQADQLQAAADIAALKRLTDGQLTTEEKTLASLEAQLKLEQESYDKQVAALDAQLELAEQQLEEARGTRLAVMSIDDALKNLAAKLGALRDAEQALTPAATVAGWYQSVLGRTADASGAAYWQGQIEKNGLTSAQQEFAKASQAELAIIAAYQKLLGKRPDFEAINWLLTAGIRTQAQAEQAIGKTAGLPGYAAGGLAGMGLAVVGEAGPEIVDFRQPGRVYRNDELADAIFRRDGAARSDGRTARLEQLVASLTEEVVGLRAEARATAQHTAKTARAIERAMPDGDAIQTRETA